MRELYKYDPETCTYVKQKVNPGSWLKRNLLYVMGTLVLAGAMVWGFFLVYATPSAERLQAENRQIAQQETYIRNSLDRMMKDLRHMQDKRRQLHRQLSDSDLPQDGDEADAIATTRLVSKDEIRTQAIQALVTDLRGRAERTAVQQRTLLMALRQKRAQLAALPVFPPLKELEVISGYGPRTSSVTRQQKLHEGIDLQAALNTPVLAAATGTVLYAGSGDTGHGQSIVIDHGHGYQSNYRHLNRMVVFSGQYVQRGQVIAYTGNTGLVRGPHLHFTVLKNGQPTDPLPYLTATLPPATAARLREKSHAANQSME